MEDSLADGLVAVGDVMLGDSAICVGFGFHSRYPRDAAPALAGISKLLGRGDVVIGNLESMLARPEPGSSRYRTDQMRGDPEYATALRRAGFTALSVANNHAMQHGRAAFTGTIRCLHSVGIACVGLRGRDGWCADPVTQTTRSGLQVGLLGYSWRPRQYDPSEPLYAEGDVESVADDVRRLRRLTDVVVVSLHWGDEFLGSPSEGEVSEAHQMIDAGACVIIGHHPHVVRPIERYGHGVICYSLGNFVTDMIWHPALRTGAALRCRLGRQGVSDATVTTVWTDDSYQPAPAATEMSIPNEAIRGLPESAYRAAVARSVRHQRRAAYLYAARKLLRYPPAVFAELAGATIGNKLQQLFSRARLSRLADRDRPAVESVELSSREIIPRSRKLSVLHVVAPAHYGGLESVVRALAAGHTARGHSVAVGAVVSSSNAPHPFIAGLQHEGVSVISVVVDANDYRGERRAVRAMCRTLRPDVVHTHGFRSDVVDGSVARSEGAVVVSTCHGFIDTDLRGRLYQWLQRRTLKRFDAVIAVSAKIEQRLRRSGVPSEKIHVIPNAYARSGAILREEARQILALPDSLVIGWVGRLSSEKGPDLALKAFARIGRVDVGLLMIGEGRDSSMLRTQAAALGISERVFWRGAIPDAGKLFSAFDAFLLSSRTEGTPIVLLEAMSAAIPIVATSVGGVPDVVDESTARLIPNGDVDRMAAALTEVFSEPDEARARAARARARLEERFGIEAWLSEHESLYTALLESRRKH